MHDHGHGTDLSLGQAIVLLPFAAAAIIYVAAAVAESGKGRPWPWWRTLCWMLGLAVAALVMTGTTSVAPDRPFTDHAVGHLLIGMVAPLLLVQAAPVTLALRSFARLPARRLSRVLRSAPARLLGHPATAGVLSVGSLWLLYTTPLHSVTAEPFLHRVVLLHFLAAGFLFTAVIAPVDPSPHRAPLIVRLVILALALAAHGVLMKALYASASGGTGVLADLMRVDAVSRLDLQTGAQIMFYGGDLVDLVLIALVLWGWYRASGRRAVTARRRVRPEQPARVLTATALPEGAT
ncbi:cytochrome c oxidase assembly protein [Microbacterium sp. 179-I 3D2 NHS]|uniref:cytochrome c oxidase assembly protein n=1 Tax=Microbacterium sp. 179-I 3D2 NHS TaxID=3235178 RepID=UPI00399F3CDA